MGSGQFRRQTSQYQPRLPPSDLDGGDWILAEFQRIADEFELLAQGKFFEEQHEEPERPRTGMLALADGTNWDPGSGRGLYWYDEDTSSWKFIS